MQKFLRLALAIGIGVFLFTQAPDIIKSAADNLSDVATGIMPVATR
jgi:hypothetical protein